MCCVFLLYAAVSYFQPLNDGFASVICHLRVYQCSRAYYIIKWFQNRRTRVSVGITMDAPVTAVSNKTNDIQYFKDI